MSIALSTRCLSPDEATRLSLALRETPNILGYVPDELQEFPDALIVSAETGDMAGVCLIKYLPQDWADIAVLFVFPEYRRKGIGGTLFRAALERLRTENKIILCVSREPSVLRMMDNARMQTIRILEMPLAVQWAYSGHYWNLYRVKESFRKAFLYRNQPPFRYAVLRRPA